MAYRKRMSRGANRRSFRKGSGINAMNLRSNPMRGGYRI
nr:MAG: hypothetical protein [Microvirus sp.]